MHALPGPMATMWVAVPTRATPPGQTKNARTHSLHTHVMSMSTWTQNSMIAFIYVRTTTRNTNYMYENIIFNIMSVRLCTLQMTVFGLRSDTTTGWVHKGPTREHLHVHEGSSGTTHRSEHSYMTLATKQWRRRMPNICDMNGKLIWVTPSNGFLFSFIRGGLNSLNWKPYEHISDCDGYRSSWN